MFLQPRADTLPACGYVGNSDVYGLGIRVGIYLQWVSSLLSKAFLDDDSLRDILNENAIFLLAIFLATILLVTDTISGVHIDVLVMLHIFFGSIFTVFFGAGIGERMEYFSSLVGIIFKTGMITGMAAIGVWFWFHDVQAPPIEPVWSSFAFLFGRVGLYSKHTVMSFKAFSAINLTYCAMFLTTTISVRFFVFLGMVALKNSDASAKYSPMALPGWEHLILQRSVKDKKKLMEDIRELGTDLILQSTVPSKGEWLNQFNKLIEERNQEKDHAALAQSDWQTLRKKLVQRRDRAVQPGSRWILDASLKVGDILNGPVRNTSGAISINLLGDSFMAPIYTLGLVKPPATQAPLDDDATVTEWSLKTFRQGFSIILSISIFLYSIVSIELLLKYNAITEVYTLLSTGQIIPFIIGIASLWRTIWTIFVGAMQRKLMSKMKKGGVELGNSAAQTTGSGTGTNSKANDKSTQTIVIRKSDGEDGIDIITPV